MKDDLINQQISKKELDFIRTLDDFDLKMFISEVHDHGWLAGRWLLRQMPAGIKAFNDEPEARKAFHEEVKSGRQIVRPNLEG